MRWSIRESLFFIAAAACWLSAVLAPSAKSQDHPGKNSPKSVMVPRAAAAAKDDTPKSDSGKTDSAPADAAKPDDAKAEANDSPPPKSPTDPTAQLKRLMPKYDVFIDSKNKQVVMEGDVCLVKGFLEMFACLKGTKEHESVVAVRTKAFVVHAALLALGAKPGSPAKFEPKYAPATGPKVGVQVYWTDEKGNRRTARGQEWVRDVKTKKAMTYDWVFAGSGFYVDEESKRQFYQADSGDFICVSNFPSAMLDIPVESSSDNDNLMFEAFTENIPPKGTKVMVVLTPEIEKPAAKGAKK
jgi:hypothetical protein